MSELSATPPMRNRRGWTAWGIGFAVVVLAAAVFGFRLDDEPHFMDESAYLSQSYFFDMFASGLSNDPRWLEYPAYDLPPLPKYLVGGSLRLHDMPRPGRASMIAWYRNPKTRVGSADLLRAGRWPSVVLGAIGCGAIFALGTMSGGTRVGLLAAVLLIANPLYRLHARRAMSDVPAECLILASLAVGMALWRGLLSGKGRIWPILAVASGALAGLAVLAKLNGGLGLMVLASWAVLGLARPLRERWTAALLFSALAISGVVALLTFLCLNPFVTARPSAPLAGAPAPVSAVQTIGTRLAEVVTHRSSLSRHAQEQFPEDALPTAFDKIKAVAVQGFGRFGPLGPGHSDSTRRFELSQDWGAIVWLPLFLLGMIAAAHQGLRQVREGRPPTAWASLDQSLVALITVTAFIPLAWDRYFLSIQAGCCLMGATALSAGWDVVAKGMGGRR